MRNQSVVIAVRTATAWASRFALFAAAVLATSPVGVGTAAPPHFARGNYLADGAEREGYVPLRQENPFDDAAFSNTIDGSDVCFLGTPVVSEFLCYGRQGIGTEGVAATRFAVSLPFWGVQADTVLVYVNGFDVPGCVTHGFDTGRPPRDAYTPGREFLVAARFEQGNLKVEGHGLFLLTGESLTLHGPAFAKFAMPLAVVEDRAAGFRYANQFAMADLVALGTVGEDEAGRKLLCVERIFKGATTERCLAISPNPGDGRPRAWHFRPKIARRVDPDGYLVFLRHRGGVGWRPVAGMRSVLAVDDGICYRRSGYVVGRLEPFVERLIR